MLADQRGELRTMASSTEAAATVESYAVQHNEGPCIDCLRTGQLLVNVDLARSTDRWPGFAAAALSLQFRMCHVLPLRLRGDVVGAMNLFTVGTDLLGAAEIDLGQAMADVATIGLLQRRAVAEREVLAEQLQTALNSRVLLEQAKGMLAERGGVTVGEAFTLMRSYARRTGQALSLVAAGILDDSIAVSTLLA